MHTLLHLTINGQEHDLPSATTITSLLKILEMAGPVLVERNGTALFPRDFDTTELAEGDQLEIIRIVAGG